MNAWWQLFPRAFTPEECEWLIQYAMSKPASEAKIGHGGKPVKNAKMRRSTVRWLDRHDPNLFQFYARLADMGERANNAAFGLDLRYFNEIQFTEYDSRDKGHYDWHEDNCWKSTAAEDRKMSMVLLLSDPKTYRGGRLELHNDPLPKDRFCHQGDVIFFPSFNRHRVTQLTSGKRYSMVTWWKGPSLR